MSDDTPRRDPMEARVITVSREALRADLAEMELRLERHIASAVERKADQAYVATIDHRVTDIERDVVRRDGPIMRGMQAEIDGLQHQARERGQLIPEFRRLQSDFDDMRKIVKNDAELRAMIREESGQRSAIQWTAFNRVAAVLLLLCTLVSLFLAYRASTTTPATDEGGARVGIHQVV